MTRAGLIMILKFGWRARAGKAYPERTTVLRTTGRAFKAHVMGRECVVAYDGKLDFGTGADLYIGSTASGQ
jgi:hypothetical protein